MTSAALIAVVMALYVTSPDVLVLYRNPHRLLLVCPILLFWSTRLWVKAYRGELHDDPVTVVSTDPATYVVGVLGAAIVFSAT
jgi:hypothetical protein